MSARVLIAGGGIGALAGALALREYAPPGVELTLLAPGAGPRARARDRGGGDGRRRPPAATRWRRSRTTSARTLVPDVLEAVDAERGTAGTRDSGLLGYDALLIAVGARPARASRARCGSRARVTPAALRAALDGLGPRPRVLFTTGAGVGWTLPLYELALLTAARRPDASVAVATPEPRPAAVFGAVASHEVSRRLAEAGVDVHTGVAARVRRGRRAVARRGRLARRRPRGRPAPAGGPGSPGCPPTRTGSCPSTATAHVDGTPASGPPATRPRARSSRAGSPRSRPTSPRARSRPSWAATSRPMPYEPALRGVLLTGGAPRFLRRSSLSSVPSAASARPLWSAPGKVADGRVARYLAAHEGFRVLATG